MPFDSFTMLMFTLVVKVFLGAWFAVLRFRNKSASWFLWWSAAVLLASLAQSVFLTYGFRGEFLSVGVGVASVIAACGCSWQAARAFEQRSPRWLLLLAGPAV